MMKKQWEFIAAMIIKPEASSSSSSSNTRLIKSPGDYLILLI
jgi:hypothetical protein